MDDANDVVTSNLQLKLRPFSTEEPAASDSVDYNCANCREMLLLTST